jgi:hypothetical protein
MDSIWTEHGLHKIGIDSLTTGYGVHGKGYGLHNIGIDSLTTGYGVHGKGYGLHNIGMDSLTTGYGFHGRGDGLHEIGMDSMEGRDGFHGMTMEWRLRAKFGEYFAYFTKYLFVNHSFHTHSHGHSTWNPWTGIHGIWT